MQTHFDFPFKLLLIGNSPVGKTSLLLRFVENSFGEEHKATIGADFRCKQLNQDGKTIQLQVLILQISIWDQAGQERYQPMTNNFYHGLHGIMIVYDVTNKKSFKDVEKWHTQVKNTVKGNVILYLVGNKSDLTENREVTREEGKDFANSLNARFFGIQYMDLETSAKSSSNVENTFITLVNDIVQKL